MLSSSYDDRPFASGVITTQTNGSTFVEITPPKRDSNEETTTATDITMDKTQSTENMNSLYTTTTEIDQSPLRIGYEKPRLCSIIQFKTLCHIIATCLCPLILVNTIFIFKTTTFHDDVFREPKHASDMTGPFNLMALVLSSCHVIIWYYRREGTHKSANLTFWVTVFTTGCLSISGFLLWTISPHQMQRYQSIIAIQYISFFGSIIATCIASISVFYEWQATKYAISY